MGFNWKDALGVVGEAALAFVPGASPVIKGLGAVAKIIGGSTGDKIEQGLSAVSEGLAEVGKKPLSSEQTVELEKSKHTTQVALAEIGYKETKLDYDDASGGRDVIKTALMSNDPLVRQARPKMMTKLGNWAIWYTIGSFAIIGLLALCKISKETVDLLIDLALYQGGTLWATFSVSFTGYTTARTIDKKITRDLDLGAAPGKLLKGIAKLGYKIS